MLLPVVIFLRGGAEVCACMPSSPARTAGRQGALRLLPYWPPLSSALFASFSVGHPLPSSPLLSLLFRDMFPDFCFCCLSPICSHFALHLFLVEPLEHCTLRTFLCKYYNFCKWLSSLELSPVLTFPFSCINLLLLLHSPQNF